MSVEEDKLLEIKYARRASKTYKTNIESNSAGVKSDGSFKFHFGRIHFVFVSKFIYDVKVCTIAHIYYTRTTVSIGSVHKLWLHPNCGQT